MRGPCISDLYIYQRFAIYMHKPPGNYEQDDGGAIILAHEVPATYF